MPWVFGLGLSGMLFLVGKPYNEKNHHYAIGIEDRIKSDPNNLEPWVR